MPPLSIPFIDPSGGGGSFPSASSMMNGLCEGEVGGVVCRPLFTQSKKSSFSFWQWRSIGASMLWILLARKSSLGDSLMSPTLATTSRLVPNATGCYLLSHVGRRVSSQVSIFGRCRMLVFNPFLFSFIPSNNNWGYF